MYFRKYFALGVAFLFILSLGLLVLKVSSSGSSKSKGLTFSGVCPDCGQKLPREGAKCGYCVYLARVRGPNQTGPVERELSTVGKLAIASGILGVLTLFAFFRDLRSLWRKWRTSPDDFRVIRCKKCDCKLRYLLASAGNMGQCPKCGTRCQFPALGEKPDTTAGKRTAKALKPPSAPDKPSESLPVGDPVASSEE
jgi:hypothetical protein